MIGRPQAGFTLVEILLAVSLLALVMALGFTGIRAGAKAVERGEVYIDTVNRLRLTQGFLRKQLSHVLPLVIVSEEDDVEAVREEQIIFEGERDYMRFVAPMPGYLGFGGPHVQALRVVRTDDGRALEFGYGLLNGWREQDLFEDNDFPPVILVEGVANAEFSYLDMDDEGLPTQWLETWEEPWRTPVMVRIEVELEDESIMPFPAIDVPVLIDTLAERTSSRPVVIPGAPPIQPARPGDGGN